MDLKFNWLGDGFSFGQKVKFFSVSAHGLELMFSIYKHATEEGVFSIKRETKSLKTINKNFTIDEDVKNIYLIKTDVDFRKKMKHSYHIIKFETESHIVNIGAYSDSLDEMTPNNSYLLCTSDFINLLAPTEKIEDIEQIRDTCFNPLMCLLDKNEMTKELLRE
jgi:hypothetical protein